MHSYTKFGHPKNLRNSCPLLTSLIGVEPCIYPMHPYFTTFGNNSFELRKQLAEIISRCSASWRTSIGSPSCVIAARDYKECRSGTSIDFQVAVKITPKIFG